MSDAPIIRIQGLFQDHEFYLMDISYFDDSHKKFLQDHLTTLHAYSWMDGIESDKTGDHYLYVRGNPYDIDRVVGEMIAFFEPDDDGVQKNGPPAYSPSFDAIDPDEISKWRRFSVRRQFELTY